jgi:hypothetical protein
MSIFSRLHVKDRRARTDGNGVEVAPEQPRPSPGASGGGSGLIRAAGTLLPPVVFGLLPLALTTLYLVLVVRRGVFGYDFHHSFWPAARAVLHGENPYPPLDAHVLSKRTAFVYPPLLAILFAPFGLVPVGVATVIAVALVLASLPATLWLLGVRDWRCYTISLASPPMLACLQTAAISAPLALLLALAWRMRAARWATPVWIVVMIAAKLFLWPLLVWLAIMRGVRCALLTAIAAAIAVVAPWLLGFPGAHDYLQLLSMLEHLEASHAYTPSSLALSLGAGSRLAVAASLVAGGAVLLLAVCIRNRPDADRKVFTLVLLAALLLSPIVWAHYLLVLLPAIAIARPRLALVWFVPLAFRWAGDTWLVPSTRELTVALLVMALTTVLALRTRAQALVFSSP